MSEREELEAVSRAMHDAYEAAAKVEGWKTQESCQVEYDDLPEANKRTMLASAKAARTALLSSGYTKGNGELVEAVRHAKKFAEIIATGRDEGDNYRASEIVNICERALSDRETSPGEKVITGLDEAVAFAKSGSEGVATSGGDDWQPIETAPKDGAHILAYEGSGDAYRAAWSGECDGWLVFCGQYVVEAPDPEWWLPWTSLPTPPAQDTQRAERATNGDHHDEG